MKTIPADEALDLVRRLAHEIEECYSSLDEVALIFNEAGMPLPQYPRDEQLIADVEAWGMKLEGDE